MDFLNPNVEAVITPPWAGRLRRHQAFASQPGERDGETGSWSLFRSIISGCVIYDDLCLNPMLFFHLSMKVAHANLFID